jgi:hypothetical protein
MKLDMEVQSYNPSTGRWKQEDIEFKEGGRKGGRKGRKEKGRKGGRK